MSTDEHFDGRRFFNSGGAHGQPIWMAPRLLLAMSRRTPWPDRVPVHAQRPPPIGDATAIVTFVGHSTFLIQTDSGHILTDPVYSERASPLTFVGPRRVRQPGIAFDDLPEISVVLLSHNHYDHCDLRTLKALDLRFHPVVIAPLKNGPLLKSAGIRRIEELDWWQEAATSPMPVRLTPAQHFSARSPFDRDRALWGGFLISLGDRRMFFAGDSGYGPHFTEIRRRYGSMDLALLPIGAYEPRWFMQSMHMNPAEAVQAHLDLDARHSLGMHFGTFQLTTEGIAEPLHALAEAQRARHVPDARFVTLEPGESVPVRVDSVVRAADH
jgi:L-ascorbate metabolism protein UlaG (beta-lactamase superfamily)